MQRRLDIDNGSGRLEKPTGKVFQKPYQLFNMKEDIGESNDVISKFPKKAAELEKSVWK